MVSLVSINPSLKNNISWFFPSFYRCGLLLLLLFMAFSDDLYCSEDPTEQPIVYAVKIIGNRVTKEELILREMQLKPGVRVTPELIEEDRLRVSSLGLFNRVLITVESEKERAVVLVNVSEPFYMYPFALLAWNPKDPSKQSYGVIMYHRNVRGYGEQLGGAVWGGVSQGYTLFHRDPWFSIGGKYGLDGRIRYSKGKAINPDEDEEERINKGGGISIRRRLGRLSSSSLSIDWLEISTPDFEYTMTPGTRDRVLTMGLSFSYDHRDYRYYPQDGYLTRIGLTANRVVDIPHDYFRERIEFRKFTPVYSTVLAFRFVMQITQEMLPDYQLMSISSSNIRAGDSYERNHGILSFANFEYRFNLFKKRYYNIDGIPLLSPYMQDMKFSIEGVLFSDFGVAFDYDELHERSFYAFGGGLQFQLPYLETVHLLAGWTPQGKISDPYITGGVGVTF